MANKLTRQTNAKSTKKDCVGGGSSSGLSTAVAIGRRASFSGGVTIQDKFIDGHTAAFMQQLSVGIVTGLVGSGASGLGVKLSTSPAVQGDVARTIKQASTASNTGNAGGLGTAAVNLESTSSLVTVGTPTNPPTSGTIGTPTNLPTSGTIGTPTNPPTSGPNVGAPGASVELGLRGISSGASTPSGSDVNCIPYQVISKIPSEPGSNSGLVATDTTKKSYHHSNTAAADITASAGRNTPPIETITLVNQNGELLTVISPGAEIVEAMHYHHEGLPFLKNQPGLPPLPANCFASSEAVNWTSRHILGLTDIQDSIDLMKRLLEEGLVCHASGDPTVKFIYGFYLYCIVCEIDEDGRVVVEKSVEGKSSVKIKKIPHNLAFEHEWCEVSWTRTSLLNIEIHPIWSTGTIRLYCFILM